MSAIGGQSGHCADVLRCPLLTQSGHWATRFAVTHNSSFDVIGCCPWAGKRLMRRRDFITLLGSGAATWPLSARAQQPTMPIVAFVSGRSANTSVREVAAFHKGFNETGYVEGQNVTIEYHWLEGQYDRLPPLMADFVRRRLAVIATLGSNPAALAAKAATTTRPIVFSVGEDAVKMGLVTSLARPGGNATGINFFNAEVGAKIGRAHV